MKKQRYQILLVNDDGIHSPGLWAAANALSPLGFVTVAAPRDQASSTGRSLPLSSDGRIEKIQLKIGEEEWPVYSVGGTPAQVVLHAVMEIMPDQPDLVVSGINYGENVGTSVTVSGTVGAAIEAAAAGIPAMAVSLELLSGGFYDYSPDVDFSTAAHFTHMFASCILERKLPKDVDILKIEVPARATPGTPWRLTRLAHHRYYTPVLERSGTWNDPGYMGVRIDIKPGDVPPDSDIHTLIFDHMVVVTPLSLDMTSRVDLGELDQQLRTSSVG
jgi:5'-nucleotidase